MRAHEPTRVAGRGGGGLLPVTLVGSLPRPKWLLGPATGRQDALWGEWQVNAAHLREAQDDAVRAAVVDQLKAGLNVITDGEQRRRHFIWSFLEGLEGIDFGQVAPKSVRGGRYTHPAPRVTGQIRWRQPVHQEDAQFLVAMAAVRAGTQTKITLPGPLTVADSVIDAAYGSRRELAMDVARALNQEAMVLAATGCDVVQFDEPAFNIYLDEVEAWGIGALDLAAEGLEVQTAVHICYGYGGSEAAAWKRGNAQWDQYQRLLPMLAHSRIAVLSLEFAMPRLDPKVLRLAEGKTILFGAVDTGWDPPESVETVAERLRSALSYVSADRLHASSDCGFATIDRDLALAKLGVLSESAARVRDQLSSVA